VLFVLLAGISAARACNVPVFRYALEHWRPDAYRLVVFYRGALSETEQQLSDERDAAKLNLTVRTVDVNEVGNDADRALLASLGDASLPRAVLQYPPHLRNETPVWSGLLTNDEFSALLDSPARRELVKRLIEGQTAVWLMLDTGQAVQDDAAAALLEEQLQTLRTTLKLPELTDSPDDILRGSPPLRISFSLLRVRRDDPAEQPLIAMLLGSEPDLKDLDEPLVFPVFSRGRSLFGLAGPGISAENIRGTAAFLTGACSCQVKEQNPGFDLLIAADWNDLLSLGEPSISEAAAADAVKEPELVTIASGTPALQAPTSATARTSSHADSVDHSSTWIIGVAVIALGLFVLILRSAQKSKTSTDFTDSERG